jgi:hypothetical protein
VRTRVLLGVLVPLLATSPLAASAAQVRCRPKPRRGRSSSASTTTTRSGSGLWEDSVWYLENGFQTTIPQGEATLLQGVETDPYVEPPLAPEGSDPWVRDQARQLRDALLLAGCQPTVGAYFNFELLDEERLAGWQSGVLWRDGTEKPSYEPVKAAVDRHSRRRPLLEVPGAGGPIPERPTPTEPNVPPGLWSPAHRERVTLGTSPS